MTLAGRDLLIRANPSKDGGAEPRDYRDQVATSAGPPAFDPGRLRAVLLSGAADERV